MKNRMADNLVAFVFLLLFTLFATLSMGYGFRARLVPLPVAIGSGILVLIQLIIQNSRASHLNLSVNAGELFGTEKVKVNYEGKQVKERVPGGKEWFAFSLLAVFLGMVLVAGIEVATIIFVTGYFRYINKEGWLRSLLWGAGTTVALYLLFTVILRIHFYRGLLARLI
ncbi:Protein of unknown function DUF1468 [Moorella glycerini]|uniref:Tripartite tricarboxylate transporter TctB family protein n=1 Tax=Neomoorella stamsii TaxID=1266720 RepID=A0A9X7J479_9FIRM|nr:MULTISPECIES: tripartite tricarboxylate transporter TctB family protein [Moorella]PRR73575.1 Tripartite tricarboxylate transporter TctB family protein [Moorella stamsii]CEP69344.1 Protein of unknown function DUF1468 [Moorella glycerini]